MTLTYLYCTLQELAQDEDTVNETLIGTHTRTRYSTVLSQMTFSVNKIFNDMKRRAASLRQLSFLFHVCSVCIDGLIGISGSLSGDYLGERGKLSGQFHKHALCFVLTL